MNRRRISWDVMSLAPMLVIGLCKEETGEDMAVY